ncbi:glycosyltransferase [Shewanella sp. SM69]|uniref:glycosyltransferase family 2 protein n=1 Tax=Shewanella sp. SM69 TaxID=2912802 RepID=UPI0021DAED7D|nr:glycosyltransferase family 2 protein [Shewanella sp. SM69]MCU8040297.1 glycosyltransferase [Shewanella sp. SM69]
MLFTKLIAPDSEEEIKQHWKYTDKVYISILCPCFNQEGYICDAIEGFLAQECEYRFEIIIHDDASTDNTPEILKAYQARFPSIIKLVLQTENQYSQGKQISAIVASYAQGEYLALCEGDDFWIDVSKIQKQADTLNRNPKINICITKAIAIFPDSPSSPFCDLGNVCKVLPFDFCITGPRNDFFPTASFFMRRSIFQNLPEWFFLDAPVGDYYLQFLSSKDNGCLYIPDFTVVYRRDSVGSWSLSNKNQKKLLDLVISRTKMHFILLDDLSFRYKDSIAKRFGRDDLYSLLKLSFTQGSAKGIYLLLKAIIFFPKSLFYMFVERRF